MNNLKFLKTVIVLLLFINIGTLTFMWIHHPFQERHHHGEGPGDFLTKELQFSQDQEKQFDGLRKEHHQATEILREKNKNFHDQFFDFMKSNTLDSNKVNSILDSICDTQKKLEMVTFSHFKKVRAICTPDQQKKFDEIIDDALRMMGPKSPPDH